MHFPLGIVLSFVPPWLGCVYYIAVVITWLILDSRIEKRYGLRSRLRPPKKKRTRIIERIGK